MLKNIIDYRDTVKFWAESLIWSLLTVVAFLLRLDGDISGFQTEILYSTAILLFVKMAAVYWFGTFRQSWRNTGFRDLISLLKAVVIVTAIFFVGAMIANNLNGFVIPLSVPLIEMCLSLLILSGLRVATRFYFVYRSPGTFEKGHVKRVLIAGAGESGNMAAREMFRHSQAGLKPIAFLDDDKSKHGQKFHGIPVVGSIEDMKESVAKLKVDEILIAMPSESGKVIRRIVGHAASTGVHYKIIPSIYDLISGKVTINQIRNVDVGDLLRRKPVQLNMTTIENYIKEKVILVTGAGGSIGSEIVRQLARFEPEEIILLGRGENSIHQLINEINFSYGYLKYKIRIADVRDYNSMERIFREDNPQVIFHAAAHKHVPLMEENPEQAVLNNVMGTRNLVNLAVEYGIKHFVNISTDKAVNPTSVMGATKRISEQIVQWGASQAKNGENYVSVRFGNVLGSRGSVIPIFKEQIKRGGPLSITHPDMVRYFMTIPEASQLVLQAGALQMNGSVFVLDMGEPVNIEQMARDLINLSGLEPDKDIKIEYTGIRPGEKLFEELLTAEEGTKITQHEKIYVAKSVDPIDGLSDKLDKLIYIAENSSRDRVKDAIKEVIPTYHHKTKEVLNF